MTGNYSLNKSDFIPQNFGTNSSVQNIAYNQKNNSNTPIKPSENGCFKALVGIRNISDYSPFGVLLPERTVESAFFRRGFQGQEHDDEVKGNGNSINFKYRMHDPRLGRFFAVDPLASVYPGYSPYVFCVDNPIVFIDPDGRKIRPTNQPAQEHFHQKSLKYGEVLQIDKSSDGTLSTNKEISSIRSLKSQLKRIDRNITREQVNEAWIMYNGLKDPKVIEIQLTLTGSGSTDFTFQSNSGTEGSGFVAGTPRTENSEQSEFYYILKQKGTITPDLGSALYDGTEVMVNVPVTDENGAETGETNRIPVTLTPNNKGMGWVFFKNEDGSIPVKGQIFVDQTGKTSTEINSVINNAIETVTNDNPQ